MPDMSAETLLGATGWASGSQMWSGTMPAFTPNPAKNSRKTAPCSAGGSLDASRWKLPKSVLPAKADSSRKAARIMALPA